MSQNKNTALLDFVTRLGDNSLIAGHRLSEWSSNGPFLEEDIGMINIALDFIGQSRILLTYAGVVEGKERTEDDFAYFRNHEEFKNALLLEQPNGDFAVSTAKQFYYSVFNFLLYSELQKSKDETLAGFAAKALKEVTYHLRHSSEWVLRLGDGTEESKMRMQKGIDDLWMYTGDLFATTEGDLLLQKEGIIPDVAALKSKWLEMIADVFKRATLTMPDVNAFQQKGSREKKHTEYLSYIVGEMQSIARVYPGAKW
ncbi:MAG: phenylacetate-CoA oxygenase subunit PaaC [Bacteroidetes bacterium]|jgi:ring-1,2-phenylacetyl-CoA epoxidase subunit PaaC|nr:phenylacetate-CoA oxygenase subunit PaaC [Bacteroidota bacterium]